ncbi:uncharacterized protein TNIN_161531 [Trichonephila inaurata madagascariensis]|uniref:Uncharacterized protein n=1 Tax=Trichonephila inaurata madagascariensis TaxID=2747483 RepID=A0A8X7BSW7_9ARAC|nr:uncharacterized protein TNIN_161531 [Trichonephila inaurata madagascariensis]
MRFLFLSWLAVLSLEFVMVSCQQDLPLWSGQAISKELLRPYLLDSSEESSDYESPKVPALASYTNRQAAGGLKKRVVVRKSLGDRSEAAVIQCREFYEGHCEEFCLGFERRFDGGRFMVIDWRLTIAMEFP